MRLPKSRTRPRSTSKRARCRSSGSKQRTRSTPAQRGTRQGYCDTTPLLLEADSARGFDRMTDADAFALAERELRALQQNWQRGCERAANSNTVSKREAARRGMIV